MELKGFDELPHIHSMGICHFDPIWSERNHADIHNELIYLRKGKLSLDIEGNKYLAGQGDIIFVPANRMHRDEFDIKKDLEVFLIYFDWPAAAQYFKTVTNNLLLKLSKSDKCELVRHADAICQDISGDAMADMLLARSRLLMILLSIFRLAGTKLSSNAESSAQGASGRKNRKLMLEAKKYIEVNYMKRITLEDIASDLSVSPFHLSHVFSQENSLPLFSYLTSLRMEKAKSLLSNGRLNVSQAAYAVGYENISYFSKSFKRYFGKSPSSLDAN